jgi:hypothetical protein
VPLRSHNVIVTSVNSLLKKVSEVSVSTRDVNNQTLPRQS